jgi:hypothetical protein
VVGDGEAWWVGVAGIADWAFEMGGGLRWLHPDSSVLLPPWSVTEYGGLTRTDPLYEHRQ